MDLAGFLVQLLNGVQAGFLLFLVASGLTLVFGIIGVINLAHGAFYMIGAYLAFWLTGLTGSLLAAVVVGVAVLVVLGIAVERLAIGFLYNRDHLQQVLLTFGLILVLDDLQRLIWGSDFHSVPVPAVLSGAVALTQQQDYPVYRLFVSAVCIAVALGLFVLIQRTRVGMAIRAAASNREMAEALGIDVGRLFTLVFALGVALAGFAGMVAAPISAVYPGMGDRILILAFVIVVIGGIGSVKGAFAGAMLVGIADTFGRVLVPEVASMVMYGVMAVVLLWRPQGLFGRPA
ncbi:MAG: branched-chain amino acid ABC transporter permease [Rhodospirillales bacterium]|nr:MAG: branched-chain amino acid ABC transporter permease [Rhodospirillales bacterium]